MSLTNVQFNTVLPLHQQTNYVQLNSLISLTDDPEELEIVGNLFDDSMDNTNNNDRDERTNLGESSGLTKFRNYYNLESGGKYSYLYVVL